MPLLLDFTRCLFHHHFLTLEKLPEIFSAKVSVSINLWSYTLCSKGSKQLSFLLYNCPTVWNSLLDNLCYSTIRPDQFQQELKTYLFACLHNIS